MLREPPIAIGDTVADKYVVERVLGEGGMGVVVAARHRELDQRVAIKCLLPEIGQQSIAAERFRREARAVVNMRSEHICRVLDVGTLPGDIPYMIMEYLEGCDLSQELERRGRIPYPEAVDYLLQACDALSEAHHAGIIHRDLKPANLFLERRGDTIYRLKVLDFGVSKSLMDTQSSHLSLTRTANLVGSPLYMSPEQLESSRDVDERTDVWSLGVVLYELISGQPPFNGTSIPQLVASVINEAPKKLSADIAPAVPAELEAIIGRMLNKDREGRPASVEEVSQLLSLYAARRPNTLRRTTSLAATEPSTTTAGARSGGNSKDVLTQLSWDRSTTTPSRRVSLVVAVAVIALAAIGALFVYLSRSADPTATAGETEPGTKTGTNGPNGPNGPLNGAPVLAKPLPTIPTTAAQSPVLPGATPKPQLGSPAETVAPTAVRETQPTTKPEPTAAAEASKAQPAPKTVEASPSKPAKPAAATSTKAEQPAPTAVQRAPIAPAAHAAQTPSEAPTPTPTESSTPARGAPPRGQISDFGGRR